MQYIIQLDQNSMKLVSAKKAALSARDSLLKASADKESPFFSEALSSINKGIEVINRQLESEASRAIRSEGER
jgi:hypothetical protein